MPESELPEDLDDLALARVLDGLGPQDDADPAALAAHERAVADVDAIARALGLIGDTLGVEEAVVAPASGVVVPLRRRPSWAPLAAAASVVILLGVGTVVLVNHDSGGSGSSSTAAQGPAHAAAAPDASTMAPMQGQSMMAVPAPAAPAAAAPAAGTSASSSGAAAKSAAASPTAPSFAAAVGCARGIVLGKVVSITGAGGRQYTLVLQVIEWISSGSGSSVTYQVGSAYAADDSTIHRLTVGQQRVFIVPQDPSAQIRAYPDSTSLRSRISKAASTGQSCG